MFKIQPVSKGYFPSAKVTLREIARKRRAGNVLIADRHNPDGTSTQVFLIPEPSKHATPGKLYEARHLRTDRPYGKHLVLADVSFKFKDGVLFLGDIKPGTSEYADVLDVEAVAFELI
jgi:hypothetical protein